MDLGVLRSAPSYSTLYLHQCGHRSHCQQACFGGGEASKDWVWGARQINDGQLHVRKKDDATPSSSWIQTPEGLTQVISPPFASFAGTKVFYSFSFQKKNPQLTIISMDMRNISDELLDEIALRILETRSNTLKSRIVREVLADADVVRTQTDYLSIATS